MSIGRRWLSDMKVADMNAAKERYAQVHDGENVGFCKICINDVLKDKADSFFDACKQDGRREVVEWVKNNLLVSTIIDINDRLKWQFKVKEWGL